MHSVDLRSLINARQRDLNLSIKAPWTLQCTIKDVSSVRCGQNDHGFFSSETIHLDEELVQSVVSLVIASKLTMPLLGHGIDLINEDD